MEMSFCFMYLIIFNDYECNTDLKKKIEPD